MAEQDTAQNVVGPASGLTAEQHLQGLLDKGVSAASIRDLKADDNAPDTVKQSILKLKEALAQREGEGEQIAQVATEAPDSVPEPLTVESSTNVQGTQGSLVTDAPTRRQRPQSGGFVLNFGEEDQGYELDFGDVQGLFTPSRNTSAELAVKTTSMLILQEDGFTEPRTGAEQQDMEKAAAQRVKEKRVAAAKREAENRIVAAETNEDVVSSLRAVVREEQRPVLLSDMNYEATMAEYKPSRDVHLTPAREIANNMKLAGIAQKASDNLWDQTGWFDIAVDALEALSPTFVLSERSAKAGVAESGVWGWLSVGGSYEDLAEKLYDLPSDKREQVVESIINEIVEQETYLFYNNNSLLQADQLSMLAETLRDGFAAFTKEGGTVTESMEYSFGIFDAVMGVGAWTKTGRNFLKGMVRRVAPNTNDRAYAGARNNIGSTADTKVAANPVSERVKSSGKPGQHYTEQGIPEFAAVERFIPVMDKADSDIVPAVLYRGKFVPVDDMKDAVDQLDLRATGKLDRGKMKEIDAERSQVGAEVARLKSRKVVEQEAQKYIEQGMSRKNAMRRAKKDLQVRIDELEEQREYLNAVFRQSLRYSEAEAEATRLRQALDGDVQYIPRNATAPPKTFKQVVDSGEVMTQPELAMKFATAVDEAAEVGDDYLNPELQWSAVDSAPIQASIRDIGEAQLVAPEHYRTMERETARTIERVTGSSLKHNPSMTVWRANDDVDSLGDYKVYFGDGDKGFSSAEEAKIIGRLAIGEDLKAVEVNGRWYLEKGFRHKYNPNTESGKLNASAVTSLNPLAAWFLNPIRKLGAMNLFDVWGNIEANRAIASNVLKPAKKALKGLHEEEVARVSKMLDKGDEGQKVYTKDTALEEFGYTPSDREMEAYFALRKVFDTHYEIINQGARKAMQREGWKAMRGDGDDMFFGEVISAQRAADEADTVYDMTTGSVRQVGEIEEGYVFMKSHVAKQTEDGRFTVIVGRPDDVGELPSSVVHYRQGHVPRIYADRRYKIQEAFEETVNGRTVTRSRTLGIARNEAEADDIRKALIAGGRDASRLSGPVRTVENPMDDVASFMDDISVIGYASSNIRARGEQLLGANMKPARIADPLESAAVSSLRIEKELNKDVVATLERRFMNTWGEYLRDTEGKRLFSFPREGQLKFAADTPESVVKQIKNFHGYVSGLNQVQQGKFAEYFNSALQAVENALYGKFGVKLPDSVKRVIDSDIQRGFMKLATNAFIIGRPLFQIPTNLLQTVFIMTRYPVYGTKAAARALGVVAALAERNSDNFKSVWKAFSKTGYSDEQLQTLLDLIDGTGIVRTTGGVDDFLGLTGSGLRQRGAESFLGRTAQKAGRVAASPVRMALNASSKAQEGSINFINLVALIAEFDKSIAEGVKLTARNKSNILNRARRLTQTQNSLDKFGYQEGHNPLQLMFQFVQHINKLFLDIALEPYVKAALGRGLIKGNEGVFAESRAVALRTIGITLGLFGVNGLPIGSDASGRGVNYLREMFIEYNGEDLPDEIWQTFQGGLINMMINGAIEGNVDVTARVSPSALVDVVVDMYNDMSLDIFGAAGGLTGTVFDIGVSVKTLWSTPELDTMDKAMATLKETASLFSGVRDFEKAMIAKTWLTHPYMSTLSGPMRVTAEEAIFSAFSINAKTVEDLYRNADFGSGSADKSKVDTVSDVMIRQMNRELTALKSAGKLDYLETQRVMKKWVEMAKTHVDPIQYSAVVDNFEFYMIREEGQGFRAFIKDYIDGQTLEKQIRVMKRLRSETQFQDYKEFLDSEIFLLEEASGGI